MFSCEWSKIFKNTYFDYYLATSFVRRFVLYLILNNRKWISIIISSCKKFALKLLTFQLKKRLLKLDGIASVGVFKIYVATSAKLFKQFSFKIMLKVCFLLKTFYPFHAHVPFLYPLKARGFLTLSGGIEMKQRWKMGLVHSSFVHSFLLHSFIHSFITSKLREVK